MKKIGKQLPYGTTNTCMRKKVMIDINVHLLSICFYFVS